MSSRRCRCLCLSLLTSYLRSLPLPLLQLQLHGSFPSILSPGGRNRVTANLDVKVVKVTASSVCSYLAWIKVWRVIIPCRPYPIVAYFEAVRRVPLLDCLLSNLFEDFVDCSSNICERCKLVVSKSHRLDLGFIGVVLFVCVKWFEVEL